MFARLGYRVLALKRVRTGNLTLGDLKEGEVRELTAREIARLLER
jgi:16S rRNA U516 pseudouridylate synthase RsuA-like enzyme